MTVYHPKFFTLPELCASEKAKALGIVNVPDFDDVPKLLYLCEHVLDPLRLAWGKPLKVTSSFRTPALNIAIGGAKNSQHMCTGMEAAVDLDPGDLEQVRALATVAMRVCIWDQMLIESIGKGSWLHLSIRMDGKNRLQILNLK